MKLTTNTELLTLLYDININIEEKVAKNLNKYYVIKNLNYSKEREETLNYRNNKLTAATARYRHPSASFSTNYGFYVFLNEKSVRIFTLYINTYKNCNKVKCKDKENFENALIRHFEKKNKEKWRTRLILEDSTLIRKCKNDKIQIIVTKRKKKGQKAGRCTLPSTDFKSNIHKQIYRRLSITNLTMNHKEPDHKTIKLESTNITNFIIKTIEAHLNTNLGA